MLKWFLQFNRLVIKTGSSVILVGQFKLSEVGRRKTEYFLKTILFRIRSTL